MVDRVLDIRSIPAYAAERRWRDIVELSTVSEQVDLLNETDTSLLIGEFAYYGKEQLIEIFLDRRGDPNFRCRDLRERTIYAPIFESYPDSTPIGQSILGWHKGRFNTIPALNLLLRVGADPDLHTYSGYTPLQLSIVMDCYDHAKMLLEYGADPYKPSTDMDLPDSFYFAEESDWAVKLLTEWETNKQ